MSEPEKPKRRFWQIHLSTAVLTMLACGVFVGLNLRNSHEEFPVNLPQEATPEDEDIFNPKPLKLVLTMWSISKQGWPFAFRETIDSLPKKSYLADMSIRNLILDCSAVSALTFAFCALCEWLIRRREGRKP